MAHVKWFVDTGERLNTVDGKEVEIWEFRHENDSIVLSEWAKHFRNHYCLDSEIDFLRGHLERSEYLKTMKFPNKDTFPGPSIRAGDFGEILVADYLQWVLHCWVPRVRWSSKMIRNESPKGCDIIGFQFETNYDERSNKDVLWIIESKTKFSQSKTNRLQSAINDSAKDPIRIGESLNYLKNRLFDREKNVDVKKVERFQNPVDSPFKEIFGAVAIISEECFDIKEISESDCTKLPIGTKLTDYISHPKIDSLLLLVIKGEKMMDLVNELYKRAADEA